MEIDASFDVALTLHPDVIPQSCRLRITVALQAQEMLRGLPEDKLAKFHLQRDKLYLLLASDAQALTDDWCDQLAGHIGSYEHFVTF